MPVSLSGTTVSLHSEVEAGRLQHHHLPTGRAEQMIQLGNILPGRGRE